MLVQCPQVMWQVKALEIIDQLETTRRGPYGGGIGHVGFNGSMDIALALRTMDIPTAGTDSLYSYDNKATRRDWAVHLQVFHCPIHMSPSASPAGQLSMSFLPHDGT